MEVLGAYYFRTGVMATSSSTVESLHALNGITVRYALHNEVRQIVRVKG